MAAVVPAVPRQRPGPLDGLAAFWDSEEVIRRRLIHEDRLLVWPSQETVGVPSYRAVPPNYDALCCFFQLWAETTSAPKSPAITLLEVEVGGHD